MIDIIFNAGENAYAFMDIVTTLGIPSYQGMDGANLRFQVPNVGNHPDDFRAALESLYAANFPKEN